MSSPVSIEYITPFPRPASTYPEPDAPEFTDFAAKLAKETDALFGHSGWTDQKTWHAGLAETSCLPGSAVDLAPPPKETAEDPAVQAQQKKNKALKGEEGLKKLADGLSFHQRSTVVDPSSQKEAEGLKYEHFWNALAKDHIQQEQTYVDNFREAVPVDGHHETYVKLYDLPFPTQNRSFLARLVVVNNPPDKDGLRSFAVYALPVIVDTQPEEKGHTRGRFVSVEEVKELEGGKLLWRCASMSTPGGSIPSKLSEGYAAGSMADAAPQFLKWLKNKVASTPGFDDAPEVAAKGGDAGEAKEDAKSETKEDASEAKDGLREESEDGKKEEQKDDAPKKEEDEKEDQREVAPPAEEEAAVDAQPNGDAPRSSEDAAAGAVQKLSVQDDEASSAPAKSPAASTPSNERDEFVDAPEAPVEQLQQAAEPVPAAEPETMASGAGAGEAQAEYGEGVEPPKVGEDGLLPSMQGFEVLTAGGTAALGKPVAAH